LELNVQKIGMDLRLSKAVAATEGIKVHGKVSVITVNTLVKESLKS